jgi:hypothetical protein
MAQRVMSRRSEKFDVLKALAVYVPGHDGRGASCIGHLVTRARYHIEALDASVKSIGTFADQDSAVAALLKGAAA